MGTRPLIATVLPTATLSDAGMPRSQPFSEPFGRNPSTNVHVFFLISLQKLRFHGIQYNGQILTNCPGRLMFRGGGDPVVDGDGSAHCHSLRCAHAPVGVWGLGF